MRRVILALAMPLMVGIATPAAAQLVNNGSFEKADFTGWTTSGDFITVDLSNGAYPAEDGNYLASLGTVGSNGTLSQLISTTAGTSYELSYYLASDGLTPNYFSASWDNAPIAGSTFTDLAAEGYILYQFTVTGSGSDTLTFNERNDLGELSLDNVSLVPLSAVPELSTWGMMLLGFGAIGLALRGRRTSKAAIA